MNEGQEGRRARAACAERGNRPVLAAAAPPALCIVVCKTVRAPRQCARRPWRAAITLVTLVRPPLRDAGRQPFRSAARPVRFRRGPADPARTSRQVRQHVAAGPSGRPTGDGGLPEPAAGFMSRPRPAWGLGSDWARRRSTAAGRDKSCCATAPSGPGQKGCVGRIRLAQVRAETAASRLGAVTGRDQDVASWGCAVWDGRES